MGKPVAVAYEAPRSAENVLLTLMDVVCGDSSAIPYATLQFMETDVT
jgi:hypothetical protein